jgi:hypothetical protein
MRRLRIYTVERKGTGWTREEGICELGRRERERGGVGGGVEEERPFAI